MKDNDPKLDKLLRGARDAPDFVPPKNFADLVMSKVTSCSTNNLIMIDFIMPKIVWAAALVLAVFLTSEVIIEYQRSSQSHSWRREVGQHMVS